MTTWRIYSADVTKYGRFYTVVYYNMFGREIGKLEWQSKVQVEDFLAKCKKTESKFQYTWDD